MFVIAIRQYGADEVNEIVGPFATEKCADSWLSRNRPSTPDNEDPAAWYDVYQMTVPTFYKE